MFLRSIKLILRGLIAFLMFSFYIGLTEMIHVKKEVSFRSIHVATREILSQQIKLTQGQNNFQTDVYR